MSMDFTEFTFRLGADPHNPDPAFLRARDSSPEFRDAVRQAERFETQLERALALDVPPSLLDELRAIPGQSAGAAGQAQNLARRWRLAVAASLLVAVGAAGMTWRLNYHWDSVEEYVVDHYRHDGASVLARAGGQAADGVGAMLAEFGVEAAPALAGIVRVIKNCPTPDGKGLHMVLATELGLITLIYMPDTTVTDGERVAFDDREAMLVALQSGSAVLIGPEREQVERLRSLVQESIVPVNRNT